jgi:hypothetical protein
MDRPRWPVIAALAIVGVLLAVGGWAIGRSSTDDSKASADAGPRQLAIRLVGGVPVGVMHTRAGALAAADNYVAIASETAIQDPKRYAELVRRAYAPGYQRTALREARAIRDGAPNVVADYRSGRRGLAVVAARRLDSYDGATAIVTTWRVGVVWSPTAKPSSEWFLTQSTLRWTKQRWTVEKVDDTQRPAPAPALRYRDAESLRTSAFDRELRGMSAPVYGATQ